MGGRVWAEYLAGGLSEMNYDDVDWSMADADQYAKWARKDDEPSDDELPRGSWGCE